MVWLFEKRYSITRNIFLVEAMNVDRDDRPDAATVEQGVLVDPDAVLMDGLLQDAEDVLIEVPDRVHCGSPHLQLKIVGLASMPSKNFLDVGRVCLHEVLLAGQAWCEERGLQLPHRLAHAWPTAGVWLQVLRLL